MYRIKLDKFEGPLDLLHHLIESKKLEITEISLAQVADQFLVYLKDSGKMAMADLANFLVAGGRLALIKSRALLPFLQLTSDEEKDINSLKEQLAEYAKYRELAKGISKLDKIGQRYYERPYLAGSEQVFYFPKKITVDSLASSLTNLLSTITLPQRIPQAQAITKISLEKKLLELEKIIRDKVSLKFSEVLLSSTPEEKVIAFLSVLELLKRAKIDAQQKINFDEINLKWQILQA